MSLDLNEVVKVDQSLPDDIIDALLIQYICRPTLFAHPDDSLREHLARVASDYGDPKERQEAIELAISLHGKGIEYFKQGYRIEWSRSQMLGLPFAIPANALIYRIMSDGWVGTTEQCRLAYVFKV